jgi:hypothetical protein
VKKLCCRYLQHTISFWDHSQSCENRSIAPPSSSTWIEKLRLEQRSKEGRFGILTIVFGAASFVSRGGPSFPPKGDRVSILFSKISKKHDCSKSSLERGSGDFQVNPTGQVERALQNGAEGPVLGPKWTPGGTLSAVTSRAGTGVCDWAARPTRISARSPDDVAPASAPPCLPATPPWLIGGRRGKGVNGPEAKKIGRSSSGIRFWRRNASMACRRNDDQSVIRLTIHAFRAAEANL